MRVAEMKMRNKIRWDAKVAESEKEAAPTGGILFNRSNPLDDAGYETQPYVRSEDKFSNLRGEITVFGRDGKIRELPADEARELSRGRWHDPIENPNRYVPVSGYDVTSVGLGSYRKFRIPATSVVNKIGDVRLLCCCGWRLTAAQWIWWLNLLCFGIHTFMVFFTLEMAYWRWGRSWNDTDHLMVQIYRITSIPTPEMIANNETLWSPGWNLTSSGGGEFFLRENAMPVNFATLTMSFFAVSAAFHFCKHTQEPRTSRTACAHACACACAGACVVGLFERYWHIYWRRELSSCCCSSWCGSEMRACALQADGRRVHAMAMGGVFDLRVADGDVDRHRDRNPRTEHACVDLYAASHRDVFGLAN